MNTLYVRVSRDKQYFVVPSGNLNPIKIIEKIADIVNRLKKLQSKSTNKYK